MQVSEQLRAPDSVAEIAPEESSPAVEQSIPSAAQVPGFLQEVFGNGLVQDSLANPGGAQGLQGLIAGEMTSALGGVEGGMGRMASNTHMNEVLRGANADTPESDEASDSRAEAVVGLVEGMAADLGLSSTPTIHAGDHEARSRTESAGGEGLMRDGSIFLHPRVDARNTEGRRVLAHELVHVAQRQLPGSADPAAAEVEAEQIGQRAASGGAVDAVAVPLGSDAEAGYHYVGATSVDSIAHMQRLVAGDDRPAIEAALRALRAVAADRATDDETERVQFQTADDSYDLNLVPSDTETLIRSFEQRAASFGESSTEPESSCTEGSSQEASSCVDPSLSPEPAPTSTPDSAPATHVGSTNADSVGILQGLLDGTDSHAIYAADHALRGAVRARQDAAETDRIRFTSSQEPGQGESYDVTLVRSETDRLLLSFQQRVTTLSEEEESNAGTERTVSAPWHDFAVGFNRSFASILHVFGLPEGGPGDEHQERRRGVAGQRSGVDLHIPRLRQLFTEDQRHLLMGYFGTGIIPSRLFNGDEVGGATAQQRLLMSSSLLSNGSYQRGSVVQGVHARMCFHWAHITHHYAGVTPATGPLTAGVMGSSDHNGEVVLGSGRSESVHGDHRTPAADLPDTETPGGTGPIPEGSAHARRAASGLRTHRSDSMPWDGVMGLRPGDWIYYYNANGSGGGGHTVIFSRWAGEAQETDGVHYREAIVFSQRDTSRGGAEHNTWLGDRLAQAGGHSIHPVTRASRVAEDAHPARTPEEAFPHITGRRHVAASAANERYLRRYPRVDRERLRDWLRDENRGLIDRLGRRLADGQRGVLLETNGRDDLDALVHLNQRLHNLLTNTDINDAATRAADETVSERHREASGRADEQRREVNERVAGFNAQLSPLQAQLSVKNTRLAEIDHRPEISRLSHRIGRIWRRLRGLRRSPERTALVDERRALMAERETHEVARDAVRVEVRTLDREIRALGRQVRRIEVRRDRVERQLADIDASMPYGSVHPSTRGQDRSRTTGRLRDLDPRPPWSTLE